MKSGKETIVLKDDKSSPKVMIGFLIGLIGFLVFYFPIFGGNLRFQTGTIFSHFFGMAGTLLVTGGLILLVWGFAVLLTGRSMSGVKLMVSGFIMMYIGALFVSPAGMVGGGKEVPKGYH